MTNIAVKNYNSTMIKERTNKWLVDKLYYIWENYFADVPRKNLVVIKFGRSSRSQLGSIKWATNRTRIKGLMKNKDLQNFYKAQDDKRITVITVTQKFKKLEIPDYVVESTIAHELCHYVHGFSSPLKQIYRNPHQGGVIKKELSRRGFGEIHKKAKIGLKKYWRYWASH